MDAEQLRLLLSQNEGPSLEFKRDFYKIDSSDGETKRRQRDELIKDILSLANGNASVAGESAYLIIGADDALNADGSRDLYDVGELTLSPKRILQLVSSACDPPLEDIWCETVELEGRRILVITIPPTPHLYETTRKLETPSQTVTEHVVFVRHNENIDVASARERAAILELKRIRFAEMKNVPPILFGAGIGAVVGGLTAASLVERTSDTKEGKIGGGIGGMLVGATLGGLIGNTYKDLREIQSYWPRMSAIGRATTISMGAVIAASVWTVISKLRLRSKAQSLRNKEAG